MRKLWFTFWDRVFANSIKLFIYKSPAGAMKTIRIFQKKNQINNHQIVSIGRQSTFNVWQKLKLPRSTFYHSTPFEARAVGENFLITISIDWFGLMKHPNETKWPQAVKQNLEEKNEKKSNHVQRERERSKWSGGKLTHTRRNMH